MRLFPNENTGKAWDHSVMQKNYQVLLGEFTFSTFTMQQQNGFAFLMVRVFN